MALCGVYPLKEAAGCVDGIAHSFFNYVSPADYHTVDWFEWCAPRVWSPTCFRNAFQYGPVSYPRLTQCTHTPHAIRALSSHWRVPTVQVSMFNMSKDDYP